MICGFGCLISGFDSGVYFVVHCLMVLLFVSFDVWGLFRLFCGWECCFDCVLVCFGVFCIAMVLLNSVDLVLLGFVCFMVGLGCLLA